MEREINDFVVLKSVEMIIIASNGMPKIKIGQRL